MTRQFATHYLLNNGKYFPTRKLTKIGNKIEEYNGLNYAINIKFFGTLKGIFITFLFAPFDRIILRDYFWGLLKLGLFVSCFVSYYTLLMGRGYNPLIEQDFVNIKIYFTKYDIDIKTELFVLGQSLLFIVWQFLDCITVYWRVKKRNYKKLMRIIKKKGHKTIKKTLVTLDVNNSDNKDSALEKWLKKQSE